MSELLIFITTAAVTALIVVGVRNLGGFSVKKKKSEKRILTEDALKALYNASEEGRICSAAALAETINISKSKADELILELAGKNLVITKGQNAELTEEGSSYALKVIRLHRLWEKYLADETGHTETNWHKHAEIMEHELTDEEADRIAAKMGNPVIDPHGDPIPLADGTVPSIKSIPFDSLKVGDTARILHVEDEPHESYAHINSRGIHSGAQVKITSKKNGVTGFVADGIEYSLEDRFTENITAAPLEKHETGKHFRPLHTLGKNEISVVSGLSGRLRGIQRRRLMDLGFVPGTAVRIQMKSPSGNPTAYLVKNTVVALRKDQADLVYIEDKKENK